jgi:hypothetical protein
MGRPDVGASGSAGWLMNRSDGAGAPDPGRILGGALCSVRVGWEPASPALPFLSCSIARSLRARPTHRAGKRYAVG